MSESDVVTHAGAGAVLGAGSLFLVWEPRNLSLPYWRLNSLRLGKEQQTEFLIHSVLKASFLPKEYEELLATPWPFIFVS